MSTRSTRKGRKKKPNPALYVGYVEDDESVDMIMKKFAQMEKAVQRQKQINRETQKPNESNGKNDKAEMSDSDDDEDDGNSNKKPKNDANCLSEDALISLFNDTSYYSISSLQRNNDIMFTKQTIDDDGFVVGMDDPDYQKLMFEVDYDVSNTAMMDWVRTDDDEYIGAEEFWADGVQDDEDKISAPRKKRGGTISRGPRKPRFGGFVGHDIGSSSLKVVSSDGRATRPKLLCHEPFYMKVPAYPIPRSWLKPIAMYDSRTIEDYKGYTYMEKDILSMTNVKDYIVPNQSQKNYIAVLMAPPFDLSESPINCDENHNGHVKLEQFAKLPIGQLIPESGMLFIWVPPELTMQINDICGKWGFFLVEHATWIMRNLSYQIENRDSNLLGLSKCNLLLFRRTKKNGKSYGRLELRHQRTSDSYFDFVRYHPETGREMTSDYHYKVIETLLPDLDAKEEGKAMYLWAPKNEKRDGWQMISDTKHLEILNKVKPDMNTNDW